MTTPRRKAEEASRRRGVDDVDSGGGDATPSAASAASASPATAVSVATKADASFSGFDAITSQSGSPVFPFNFNHTMKCIFRLVVTVLCVLDLVHVTHSIEFFLSLARGKKRLKFKLLLQFAE